MSESRFPVSETPIRSVPNSSDGLTNDHPASPLRITEVRLRFPPDQSGSLVAYGSCVISGALALNNIRIERGRREGLVTVFPTTTSASGKRHGVFYPVTREAGEAIRHALLGRLALLTSPTHGPSVVQESPR